MRVPEFATVFGVDFSGARLAGRNIWIARLENQDPSPTPPPRGEGLQTPAPPSPRPARSGSRAHGPRGVREEGKGAAGGGSPRLVALDRLEALCGTAERGPCLAELVRMVNASESALWGFDCPFGLPLDLFPAGAPWADQFAFLAEHGDDAYACGLECIARTKRLPAGPLRTALHCRRQSDRDAKAPFDAFHYRMMH